MTEINLEHLRHDKNKYQTKTKTQLHSKLNSLNQTEQGLADKNLSLSFMIISVYIDNVAKKSKQVIIHSK